MKFDNFLKDDATIGTAIATNTAGASGETSQSKKGCKKKSRMAKRLSENVLKFKVTHENGVQKLEKLKEKYPDAVFTVNLGQDFIGDFNGSGIVEVSDVYYQELKTILTDYKYIDVS